MQFMLNELFIYDFGIGFTYDTETNAPDVGIPPDALWLLRISLQPGIVLGEAA